MSPVLEYPEDMNPFGDDEETEVGTPKIETPTVGTPKIESPKIESPKVGTPKIQSPKVQTPGYFFIIIISYLFGFFLTPGYALLTAQEIALLSIFF